jgi:hypothetical protein
MLYREIIAVCSEIHTKHINTLCGQNVELLNVTPGGTHSSNRWASRVLTVSEEKILVGSPLDIRQGDQRYYCEL